MDLVCVCVCVDTLFFYQRSILPESRPSTREQGHLFVTLRSEEWVTSFTPTASKTNQTHTHTHRVTTMMCVREIFSLSHIHIHRHIISHLSLNANWSASESVLSDGIVFVYITTYTGRSRFHTPHYIFYCFTQIMEVCVKSWETTACMYVCMTLYTNLQ